MISSSKTIMRERLKDTKIKECSKNTPAMLYIFYLVFAKSFMIIFPITNLDCFRNSAKPQMAY